MYLRHSSPPAPKFPETARLLGQREAIMDDIEDGLSPMMQGAVILHENYVSLVRAGFSEEQALYLLGEHVRGIAIGNATNG